MKIVTSREELKDYLGSDIESLLYKIYDGFVRVVDPITNKIELITENAGMHTDTITSTCYEIWHKNTICTNCTSIRALLRNEPISKIETKDNLIYLVHSVPFSLQSGRKVVLEVLKNLTNITVKTDTFSYPDPDFITLLRTVDRLNERVYRDPLTNAFNREYLTTKLSNQVTRGGCTVLMVDIDNFKTINDIYGHPAGDAILQKCAGTLCSKLREHDEIVRYGGDKFIVILDQINEEETQCIIARLNEAVKDNPVQSKYGNLNYEVSIGSYTVIQAGLDLNEIIKNADEAMYEVKRRKFKK